MKKVRTALSVFLAACLLTGMVKPFTIQAEESYVGTADLKDNKTPEPASWGVLPTPAQYRYQKEELAAFVHFGPNTFNEIEWGEDYGNKTPDEIFQLEEDFDAETLVNSIKEAGFKKLIVTAKHHDGFCIWNSKFTDYDVAATSYKNGEGDILAEISAACTAADIDMGLYLSPWDIHAPEYGYRDANGNPTTPENDVLDYNDYYVNQLNEILGNDKYGNDGHFTEIWMDGAKGSGFNAQEYDFFRWYDTIQKQEGLPAGFDTECMIFQCGANTTVRWIGNETGYAAKNTWSKSMVDLNANTCNDNVQGIYSLGFENGNKWTVPEADSSITSNWFWGTKKKTPKSITELGNKYFGSVGNNATMLLNIPPNNHGKIEPEILERIKEFGDNIEETFGTNLAASSSSKAKASSVRGNDIAYDPNNVIDGDDATYWTTDDGNNTGTLLIDLGQTKVFDVVSIEEAIQFGQSINEYKVEYRNGENGTWKVMDSGETIGAKRLVRSAAVRGDQLRITVSTNKADALPIISEVGVYKASEAFELAGSAPEGMDVIDVQDTDTTDGAGFNFTGTWHAEEGNTFINGTNKWADAGASTTVTFHGSKIYLIGTRDPNHGTATISIDGGTSMTIDTAATARSTGQIIFTSDDLEDGDHTLTLTGTYKSIGLEAAYVINNGGIGMIGLEQKAYTMNENERIDVKVTRVGGTKGEVTAKLLPNPGSAIQDDFNTELIPDIILKDGETETSVPVETRRNTNVTGDRVFSVEIIDPSKDLILGFNEKAEITIKDTETSSVNGLNELITEASKNKKDWYRTGWNEFAKALSAAKATADKENASFDEIEKAISSLRSAMDQLEKREHYTAEDRFDFPWTTGSSATLEGEFSEIDNDTSNDNGWPCVVVEGDWASNGKYVDAINQNDKIKFYYTAEKAGTYHAVLYYESGSNTNAVAWSEENGKIENGQVSAGADKVGTTHTAEFDFVVKEPGDGVLVFTGPAGKSPRIDCFVITPSEIELSKYQITASANEGGTISDEGSTTVTEGENKTYTITANDGYAIKDVLVNGKSVGALTSYTFENIAADATIEVVFEFGYYTASNRFVFPSTDETATLEAEYAQLFNTGDNEQWPLCIAQGDWASNGKFIDSLNESDQVKYFYTAKKAGTYHATLYYQSGSAKNAIAWSEENGNIVSGEMTAGANATGTTYKAEFDLEVTKAGDGVLVFTGPANKSPRLDKFEIVYRGSQDVDKTALNEAIENTKTLKEADYTKASWNVLKVALDKAVLVKEDEGATAEQVNEAITALNTAVEALVKAEDTTFLKSLLKSAMDKAEALIASDDFKALAPNVQAMIKVRLNEATTVYENEDATIAECKTVYENLAEALHYAGFKADKTMLKALIDECVAMNTDQYTEASVKAFKDALAEANDVYADQNALQERIDATYSALSAAKDGLTNKPTQTVDKSALLDIINAAKDKIAQADKYVKNADWEAFVDALAKAEKVYANENATQEEVNKAAAELGNTYLNIRLIPSEEMLKQLEDFINYTKKINRALYSAKDLKVIDDAANKAQEMLDKKDFSEDEFDAFAITMGKVMDMIDDNKIEKPADKDQNKDDGKQQGVKAPGTADTTNVAGLFLLLLAGCGVMITSKKRKAEK